MPHDNRKQELKVGDLVNVPCRVKAIHLTEEYCNVDLETLVAMWPSDKPYSISLNSRQVVKSDMDGVTLNPRTKPNDR